MISWKLCGYQPSGHVSRPITSPRGRFRKSAKIRRLIGIPMDSIIHWLRCLSSLYNIIGAFDALFMAFGADKKGIIHLPELYF